MTRPKKAKALKEGEGNTPVATPAIEEKPSEEVPVPEEGRGAETEEEVPEKVSKKETKKGRSQRIRQLVKERDTEKAKAQSLTGKLAELTAQVEPQAGTPQPPTYTPPRTEPIVAPGEEVAPAELERRIQAREQQTLQKADALSILRTKQQDAINRINNEATEALRKYPELDPESDGFDKELSDSVTEAAEAHVRANPYNASVKKFVGNLMKPYKRAVTKEVGKVTEKRAKQASETALRPTSVKPSGKKFEELSEKAMEKKLGVVY